MKKYVYYMKSNYFKRISSKTSHKHLMLISDYVLEEYKSKMNVLRYKVIKDKKGTKLNWIYQSCEQFNSLHIKGND